MSADVAAVIVAHGSRAELPRCLESLQGRVGEAAVVCNDAGVSAPAPLRAAHAWVRWIDNNANRGFAAAVNQGAAATSAPHVLLLNPDCELLSGTETLVEACQQEGVAGAGGLLLDPDGSPQIGFLARSLPTPWALALEALGAHRAWRLNPVNRRYRLLDLDPSAERDVEQPAGAFLMLRRETFDAVGGMDPAFHPLWWEDVDLCRRLRDAGYSLRYEPRAKARHGGGHSARQLPLEDRLSAWYGGMLRYAGKHFAPATRRRVRLAVLGGLALRRAYCRVRGGSGGDADAYGAAYRFVRSWPPGRAATP